MGVDTAWLLLKGETPFSLTEEFLGNCELKFVSSLPSWIILEWVPVMIFALRACNSMGISFHNVLHFWSDDEIIITVEIVTDHFFHVFLRLSTFLKINK